MRIRPSSFGTGNPISFRGRIILSGCLILVSLVLGFAFSTAFYQFNQNVMRSSDVLGYMLCGEGQHIDNVPSGSGKGTRMICRDASGAEVGGRNNLIAVKMALPFILLIAIPALWMAWTADIRESSRR